jgi:hypothetical protein
MDHPEAKKDEHFVGYHSSIDWPCSYLKGLKTARLGEIAYDVLTGEPLGPDSRWRPLFVHTREVGTYRYIMSQRQANLDAGRHADGRPRKEGESL